MPFGLDKIIAPGLFAPKSVWDIKNSNDPDLGIIDGKRQHDAYIYHGELIRYDAPGNINYGYVSNAMELSKFTAKTGAQATQSIYNFVNGGNVGADNPGDEKYIDQGYRSYNKPWYKEVFDFIY